MASSGFPRLKGQVGGRLGPVSRSYLTLYMIFTVNLIGGVLAARLLGVEGRGRLALLSQAAQTSASVLEFGLGVGLVLWLGRNPGRLGDATRTFLRVTVLLTLPAGLLTLVFLLLSGNRLDLAELLLAIGLCSTALLAKPGLGLLRSAHRFNQVNRALLIVPFTYGPLLIVATLLGLSGSVATVLCLSLVASLAGAAIAIGSLTSPRWAGPRLRRFEIQEIFKSGVRSQLGVLSPMDYMQLDVLILALILPAAQVGRYAILASIASLVRGQAYAAGMVLLARFSRQGARIDEAMRAVRRPIFLALATVPVVTGAAWFGVPILYGNAFLVPLPVLVLVIAAAGAGAAKQLFYDVLRVHDRRATPTGIEVWLAGTFLAAILLAKPDDLLLPACMLFSLQAVAAMLAFSRVRHLQRRQVIE
jgi:hypothetical protein